MKWCGVWSGRGSIAGVLISFSGNIDRIEDWRETEVFIRAFLPVLG